MLHLDEYQTPLLFEIYKRKNTLPSLEIIFKPSPISSAPGLPGEQIGDCLLIQEKSDKSKLIVSLGKSDKLILDTYRQAGGAAAKWLQSCNVKEAYLAKDIFRNDEFIALLEGFRLGAFTFNRYKKPIKESMVTTVFILQTGDYENCVKTLERIEIVTDAVNMARDWGHEPANVINPGTLAERAGYISEKYGLKITILDENKLSENNAGGILSVGKGSKTQPRLIILEFSGTPRSIDQKPIVLIGKAITFDTGGYSLKDATNIRGMKYDKSGGVSVVAILKAIARLKLDIPVIGIIPAAENMVSSDSYRPDDIITMMSGKTVEIISTDAEGRLILADSLTYAQNHFQPRAIIDMATLTGGVVLALNRFRAGLLSNNDSLAEQLFQSGEHTHERLWRFPMDEDYFKLIKGDDADLKNSGGREGATISGAVFLKQFVADEIPWAHLDIAGTADQPKAMSYCPQGASGFGIRLLIDYLEKLTY
jgi:leucyl aminopeptidase